MTVGGVARVTIGATAGLVLLVFLKIMILGYEDQSTFSCSDDTSPIRARLEERKHSRFFQRWWNLILEPDTARLEPEGSIVLILSEWRSRDLRKDLSRGPLRLHQSSDHTDFKDYGTGVTGPRPPKQIRIEIGSRVLLYERNR